MTLRMMEQFGAGAQTAAGDHYVVLPGRYAGREYDVEPDASTASYFFAAAATGGTVQVLGLHRAGALQGDVAFLDVLEAMGCTVTDEPDGRARGRPGCAGRPDRRHGRHLGHVHDAGRHRPAGDSRR